METFIVTITAKPGHADEVARFYQETEAEMRAAKGFRGRKIFQARTGAMADAVRKIYTEEELARHPEPPHEEVDGTQFILIENWDSIDDRMTFSKNQEGGRQKALIPHLQPEHTHEFYEDVSVD